MVTHQGWILNFATKYFENLWVYPILKLGHLCLVTYSLNKYNVWIAFTESFRWIVKKKFASDCQSKILIFDCQNTSKSKFFHPISWKIFMGELYLLINSNHVYLYWVHVQTIYHKFRLIRRMSNGSAQIYYVANKNHIN